MQKSTMQKSTMQKSTMQKSTMQKSTMPKIYNAKNIEYLTADLRFDSPLFLKCVFLGPVAFYFKNLKYPV